MSRPKSASVLLAVLVAAASLASPVREAHATDYWDSYTSCFRSQLSGGALEACVRHARELRRFYASAAGDLTAVAPVACTDDARGMHFTGTGFVIDLRSCGPRGACPFDQLAENGCVTSTDPAPYNDRTSEGALGIWCAGCSESGCMSCWPREDVVQRVESQATLSLQRLFSCFRQGPFAHREMLRVLTATYTRFSRRGVGISCPSANPTSPGDAATADSSRSLIRLLPSFFEEENDVSTFAHEFMHLTNVFSDRYQRGRLRRIDNHNVETHNHSSESRRYRTDASGNSVPVGKERPLPNREYDRIYACESLCFPSGIVTRETCNICMSYPRDAAESGVAACDALPTRARRGEIMQRIEEIATDHRSRLEACRSSGTADPETSLGQRLECENTELTRYYAALEALDLGLDPLNANQVRRSFRDAQIRSLRNELTDGCSGIDTLTDERGAGNAGRVDRSIAIYRTHLSRLISRWNALASRTDHPTRADGGSRIPLPVEHTPQTICDLSEEERLPVMQVSGVSVFR